MEIDWQTFLTSKKFLEIKTRCITRFFNHCYLFTNIFNLFIAKVIGREGTFAIMFFFISISFEYSETFFVWIHTSHTHLYGLMFVLPFIVPNFIFCFVCT